MCSQPPQDVSDAGIVEQHLRHIDLIPNTPEYLGITGGEPTLLKDGLVNIVRKLKERFPSTFVVMLSNGRMFAYEDFVKMLSNIGHQQFLSAIPLYASNATDHDYIVQAKGAFDQTIQGLYNAARYNMAIEIRIVLLNNSRSRHQFGNSPKEVIFIPRRSISSQISITGVYSP